MMERIGLDAVAYLRFLRMLRWMCVRIGKVGQRLTATPGSSSCRPFVVAC
jgi:hypothetical protein